MKFIARYWVALLALITLPVLVWASDPSVTYTGGNVTIQSSSTDGKQVSIATIGDGNIDFYTDSVKRWQIQGADGDLVPAAATPVVDIGAPTAEIDNIYVQDVAVSGGLTVGGNLAVTGAIQDTVTVYVPAGIGRAGATAGWTNTGTDLNEALLPQSQTASTFTVPITGLQVGDTISAFKVIAQVESAGNTATLDADLRKLTNAAGDPTDASIGAITKVSATEDTAVASSKTLAAAEVLASGESLYILLTGTTAASTDVRLLGVELTVTRG